MKRYISKRAEYNAHSPEQRKEKIRRFEYVAKVIDDFRKDNFDAFFDSVTNITEDNISSFLSGNYSDIEFFYEHIFEFIKDMPAYHDAIMKQFNNAPDHKKKGMVMDDKRLADMMSPEDLSIIIRSGSGNFYRKILPEMKNRDSYIRALKIIMTQSGSGYDEKRNVLLYEPKAANMMDRGTISGFLVKDPQSFYTYALPAMTDKGEYRAALKGIADGSQPHADFSRIAKYIDDYGTIDAVFSERAFVKVISDSVHVFYDGVFDMFKDSTKYKNAIRRAFPKMRGHEREIVLEHDKEMEI